MKKCAIALVVFSLLSLVPAQLTFNPATPPAQLTPPTELYHHWVDNEFVSFDARNTTHQKGPKTVLVILVRPNDAPAWTDPPSFASLNSGLNDASQRYYSASYHQTWFGPKRLNGNDIPRLVVTPVLTLPQNADYYRGSFGLLQSHALQAVRNQGGAWNGGSLDPNNFDRWVPMSNVKMISSTGLAYVGGRFAWVGGGLTGGVTLHEWGHNWGVYHANSWDVAEGAHPRSPNGSNGEYQDGWCIMGGNNVNEMFNPMFRRQLKFLEEGRNEIRRITASDTYRIYDYVHADRRQAQGLVRGLLIPMDPPPISYFSAEIILGFGHVAAKDGGFGHADYNRNAVTVHAKLDRGSNRIDTTPGSLPGGRNDSSIIIGRTYSEPAGNNLNPDGFHITPVLRGSDVINGQTHEWIEVVINFDSDVGANQAPTASFPTTLLYGVQPGVPYSLTVTASDPNGDTLAFDWDFGDNTYNIVNSGSQTKTWATAGVYLVRATVSDMKGGTATARMWVNVGDGPFREPETPAGTLAGLNYTYYEGSYNQLPTWGNLLPVKQGAVSTFSLEPRNRNNGYAFVYEGYVEVPATDVYTFTLASRDGSRLYIGDTLVIGNDGLKSTASPVSGNIALNAGKHRIRVEMFNRDGNGVLNVFWSTLSSASTSIPASALFRENPALLTPPTVAVISPETGTNTIVGSDMTISASAASPHGISRVAVFIGAGYLGDDLTAPYEAEWSNLPVGTFFITAVAYDTQGGFSVSEPVLVNVVAPFQRDSIGINLLGTNLSTFSLAASEQAGAFILQGNWNNAPLGSYSSAEWDNTVTGLKNNEGTVTAAWTRYKSRSHSSHSPSGSSLVDSSTPNGRMMLGGLRVRHDYAGPRMEVHAIPFANYDVYVYFDQHEGVSQDATPTEYSLTPGGQSPLPSIWGQNSLGAGDGVGDYPNYDTWVGFKEATATGPTAPVDQRLGNYVVFRNVSGSMFTLRAVTWGSSLTGVQIVSTTENPSAPNIYAQPRSISLPETRTAVFSVKYIGYPEATATWFKVGTGSLGVTGDTLVLENISPADAGDYYVVATNSEGSDTSALATLTVTAPPALAPTHLVATATSISEIELTWTDNADDEDSYIVERAGAASGPWAFLDSLPANSTSYLDSGLPENTAFFYRVIASNERGESNPSNVAGETTFTTPRAVTILQHPVSVEPGIGQTASLSVVADAYPPPVYQWRKAGVDIPGATSATLTIENVQLSDHSLYTVFVANMDSEMESKPAMIVVTEPKPFAVNSLYVINGGTVSHNSGTYTMSRTGTDLLQGIVSNFQEVPLEQPGDYIELSFILHPNTAHQQHRALSFGFFNGPTVTGNSQTMVTDPWQGYVHQPGSRNTGNVTYNFARQGAGPLGLMDHAGHSAALDGVNHSVSITGVVRDAANPVTIRLERISESQIRMTTVFVTQDSDRGASGTNNGIVWSYTTASGVCTANSTFPAADGPTSFNGFAIATRGNWTLRDLAISTNVDLSVAPPVITAQPQSQTVYATQNASLSVTATGEGLSYQWFKNDVLLSGATSASLSFSPVAEANAGDYQVVVSNAGGDTPSAVATLTVRPENYSSNAANVPDLWAQTYFGAEEIPLTVDKGGVQVPLHSVYIWGLDPTDTSLVFEMPPPQINGDGMTLIGINTVPGRRYRLQFSDNLTDPNGWTDLGDEVDGNGGTLNFSDPNPGNNRAYRVRVRKP